MLIVNLLIYADPDSLPEQIEKKGGVARRRQEGSGNSKHLICMIAPSFIAMLCVHIMIILIQQIVKMRLRNCSELECQQTVMPASKSSSSQMSVIQLLAMGKLTYLLTHGQSSLTVKTYSIYSHCDQDITAQRNWKEDPSWEEKLL